MGVASGCGCKEVHRFPHTTYPSLLLLYLFFLYLFFFAAASLLFIFYFIFNDFRSCLTKKCLLSYVCLNNCVCIRERVNISGEGALSISNYHVCTVCAKKTLPLPFNETERNGSFRSRLIIFRYSFWIRS